MTTVEALKELFTALGGSEEDVKAITTNPEMVHAIAEVASGAIELPKVTAADAGDILAVDESGKWAKAEPESGLPEVSASDNGDILAVVDGAWAKSAPSGGDVYVLRATANAYGAVTLPDGLKGSDVIEIAKTKNVVFIIYQDGGYTIFTVTDFGEGGSIQFCFLGYTSLTNAKFKFFSLGANESTATITAKNISMS